MRDRKRRKKNRNKSRNKLTALLLAGSVLLTQAFSAQGVVQADAKAKSKAKTSRQAQGMTVAYHSIEDIRNYVKENGATLSDSLEFAVNPVTEAPYNPGRLSEKTQQSALKMLKQMRYIAGISDQVALSDDLCGYAQAGVFLNYVNKDLTHTPERPPGMEDALYQAGCTGAGSSNIAYASWKGRSLNETIALSWMEDGDKYNISRVGHRRWLLHPQMGKTGFGAVRGSYGTYSSVYAFDTSNSSAPEKGVAWPAQNMPTEYFNTKFPWSVSMGSEVSQSQVKVKLVRKSDNRVWNFSESSSDGDFYVDNGGYGQKGCIIFRPPSEDIKAYKDGDSYEVEITGTKQPVSYTVTFFDLEEKPAQLSHISAEYQGSPVAEGEKIKKSDVIVTAIYTDGSRKQVTNFTILPYTIKAGSNTVTIRYEGKTAEIKVTGIAAAVPDTVTVQFDAAGGTPVSARSVKKGSVLASIPATTRTGYLFEGWYTAPDGGTKLEAATVIRQDVTYYAHWKAIELSSILAETTIVRLIEGVPYEYEQDDFLVTAVYTDGSRKKVAGYTIDPHIITAGENTITIRYGGKSADVKINAVSVESISALYIGGMKVEGTTQLDDYDVRIYAKLSDGETLTLKHPEEYQVDPFVIQPGENTLTVRFGGKSQTIQVTGYREESAVALAGITAQYAGGSVAAGEKIDQAKLTVTAAYTDGSKKVVYDYTLVAYVIQEGENTLTVMYQGKTADFKVTGIRQTEPDTPTNP
ncbi:MAG: bacterial Ig-like domain-containing protein, partial [Eubacterium sp.]|nr:bacterial Ig-like domain-containing protein [Eubacterium sp.]